MRMTLSAVWLSVSLVEACGFSRAYAQPFQRSPTFTAIEFSPDGKYLLTANTWGGVGLFDVQRREWSATRFEGLGHVRNGEQCAALTATFSPDGRTAVSGGQDSTIRFWDVATGKELRQIRTDFFCVSSLSFSKDGKYLLSAEKNLCLRDGATGKEIRSLPSGPVSASALSPDGRLALSLDASPSSVGYGLANGSLIVWDTLTAKKVRELKSYPRAIYRLAFSRDGNHVMCAGGAVTVWDLSTGEKIRDIRPPGFFGCESACFTRTGRFVLMASMGEAPRLVELSTGKEALALKENLSSSELVAVSPDGKRAASAAGGGLALWDLNSGRQLWPSLQR